MKKLWVAVAVILVGCSAKYISPENGDRAQLRVVAPGFGGWAGMRIVYYENGSCDNPFVFGLISGLGSTKSDLGTTIQKTKITDKNEYFDRFIRSGKIKMTIQSSFANGRCSIPFEATLEPDRAYEIQHYWSEDHCYAEIHEVSPAGYVDVPLTPPKQPCFTGFSGAAL